ncbi:acyltransferase family protein [Brevibacterium samyangense]|uniref:Acyltransferase family protein n=1 Tax=Brevibacterium samyangense TaxID=366888 RepID=A0ABN2T8C6_9MICO
MLRAIAVLTVVIYHINPDWLPGGFVGVDVFFVISGYLITSHMLGEIEKTGKLSLLTFWSNRARRILPAATVAIIAVGISATWFLPSTQWESVAQQGIASALYVQNFALAAKSVDYLTQEAADTPFQHFWSLSVEEQFYVFWPLLAILALVIARWVSKRTHRRAGGLGQDAPYAPAVFRETSFVVFAVVVAASFVYSVAEVNAGDPTAYFITPTRVWELGVGGMLACVLGDPRGLPVVRKVLALAGVGAILAASFMYTGATPFPGTAALLPVLGCVAVIVAGRTSGLGSLHPIVDWRPTQMVGNWSYSLYLWHFPVITYYVAVVGHHPGFFFGLCVLAISLVFSIASYYLVENPVRKNVTLRDRRWMTVGAALTAMAVACAFCFIPQAVYDRHLAVQEERTQQLLAADVDGMGAGSIDGNSFETFIPGYEDIIVPVPAEARDDVPQWDSCEGMGAADARSESTPECVEANPDGEKTLVVVGDSHAHQWLPTLKAAVEGTEWKLVTFMHDSCPFSLEPRALHEDPEFPCVEPNEKTLDRILEMQPEKVLMTNLAVDDLAPDSDEEPRGTQGFVDVMEPMVDEGIDVVALRDTPTPVDEENVPDCVSANLYDLAECAIPRAESREFTDANAALEAAAERVEGVRFESLTDEFCTETECPAVIGNVLVYRDQNHISATYARTLVEPLAEMLEL